MTPVIQISPGLISEDNRIFYLCDCMGPSLFGVGSIAEEIKSALFASFLEFLGLFPIFIMSRVRGQVLRSAFRLVSVT